MSLEQKYQNFTYICGNRGLVALYAEDRLPDHTYNDLKNLEVRIENAISMRFGHIPLTAGAINQPLSGAVLSLGRLVGLQQVSRYAKTGNGLLYRGPGGTSAAPWTQISSGLNLINRTSFVQETTPYGANPFLLVADSNVMLKDDGVSAATTPWGYGFPPAPITADPLYWFPSQAPGGHIPSRGEWFTNNTQYTITNGSGNTLVLLTGVGTVESTNNDCVIVHFDQSKNVNLDARNLFLGLYVTTYGGMFLQDVELIGTGTTADPITAATLYFSSFQGATLPPVGATITFNGDAVIATLPGGTTSISPTTAFSSPWNLAFPSNTSGYAVRLQAQLTNPTQVDHVRINLSFNDATFTNYMYYDIVGSAFTAGQTTGIVVPLTSFKIVGTASFAKIFSFRIDVVTNSSNAGSIVLISLDTWFVDTAFPSSLGGIPYDYRVAGYNANTGSEGPATQITESNGTIWHSPYVIQQPIVVDLPNLSGQGFTDYRVYRRGGTLPNAWYLVGQIPVAQATAAPFFIDTMPDTAAVVTSTLAIDNYPPITTTLPTPVNTTLYQAAVASTTSVPSTLFPVSTANISVGQLVSVGVGGTAETVVVQSVGVNYFTAFLQFPHQAGEPVYAGAAYRQSANIACSAFDRVFLGGDPNNPGRLYYSAVDAPESFPPQNFIDLPGAAEVIMGMGFTSGLLFVGTLTGWHKVISVNGSTPVAVKTNARHGLFSVNALMIGEGIISYLSFDGVYLFNGSTSTEFSQAVQWVFRSYAEAAGPVPVMDTSPAGRAQVNFGYDKSETYVSYSGTDGVRRRIIYSQRDNRWRDDDISASAQLYEEDSATLIYGDDTGMIYLDRFGELDVNSQGSPIPTPINVQLITASLDQGAPKNPKNYQEYTIDINTRGQKVLVGVVLDNGTNTQNLGIVNTTTRQQVNLNLNNGLGLSSRNAAFILTAALTANIDIYSFSLKGLIDTETRQSYDTYWTEYGVNEWKLVKQGYFDYTANDLVTISCYTEGNVTTPTYTIQLLPTATRTIIWKRFPAVIAKLWRWVVTCPADFTMYENSHIEVKPVCGVKGYTRQPFAT